MIVAGLGFNSRCEAAELAELVRRAQAITDLNATVLAAPAWKIDSAALQGAAEILALPILAVERDQLAAADGRTQTDTAASRAIAGVGSVAEASALAAAGPGAWLILPRIASACATCALSQGEPS